MHKFTLICVLFGFLLYPIKCDWWENSLIYEIYTKSFKDSDGDGIGDINGITNKLDYIAELGVDAIWLPRIYSVSTNNFENEQYGIINHKQLNPIYGKLRNFQQFITKAHEKGLKVLLDFVPGYTSNEHVWFLKSAQNETIYTDYYIWANPKEIDEEGSPVAPDILEYHDSSPMWVYSESRKQFYYSKHDESEPKINLKNLFVVEEMRKILRFWLDIGVDGFFVKESSSLITDSAILQVSESQKLLHNFREILDEYKNKDGITRLFIADISNSLSNLKNFYDQGNYTITHFPFNHKHFLTQQDGFITSKRLKNNINTLLKLSNGKITAWASESHLRSRIAATLGLEGISIAAVLTLLLPGVASIFYGQEIGLRGIEKYLVDNGYFLMQIKQDFVLGFHDHTSASCPMQWDATPNAGFTKSEKGPWSDINADYFEFNVQEQKQRKDSHYHFFKELIKLRKTDTCKYGDVKTFELSDYGFAFTRSYHDKDTYIVVFNLDYNTGYIELSTLIPKSARSLTVLLGSPNSYQKTGDILKLNANGELNIEMRPASVVILTTASATN